MPYPIIDAIAGKYLIADGKIYDFDSHLAAKLRQPAEHLMYYEVIRITDNIPLFWDDHIARLQHSINGSFDLPEDLLEHSRNLISRHLELGISLEGLNLRIVATPELYVIHLIPSYYPDLAQLSAGVPTLIIDWERDNPNVKIIKADYKEAVANGFARNNKFGRPFELLLADQKGLLTEGSRSNLFFIRDNQVISAPDERILLGITRKYVIQAIAEAGAEMLTGLISKNEINDDNIDAAFLSGSPIDLLPISSIEDHQLKSADNDMFCSINQKYHMILREWLENHRHYGHDKN